MGKIPSKKYDQITYHFTKYFPNRIKIMFKLSPHTCAAVAIRDINMYNVYNTNFPEVTGKDMYQNNCN